MSFDYDPNDRDEEERKLQENHNAIIRLHWYMFLAIDVFFVLLNLGLIVAWLHFGGLFRVFIPIQVFGIIWAGHITLRDVDRLNEIRRKRDE